MSILTVDGPADATAGELVRPGWRRARVWFALALLAVVGGVLVGTLGGNPGRAFDPGSAHRNGSQALARLLDRFGTPVRTSTSVATAAAASTAAPGGAALVVVDPDAYSDPQLRRLAAGAGRLVLIRPGTRAIAAVVPGAEPDVDADPDDLPGCGDPGALAAGEVTLPDDALVYRPGRSGVTSCYGGAYLTSPRLAVLGSATLLRNDHLDHNGVAALDINAITDSRRVAAVTWLLPGDDAAGSGPASIWDLFPGGAYRVFWWLVAVGALVAVWRARRLGGVVAEPLPVVVRSAEVVEGHGRLYARAGARDRAAAALRTATATRLVGLLGLRRAASNDELAIALAAALAGPPAEFARVLAGPPPADDAGLLHLARDLDALESAVRGSIERTAP